ncbi:ABC transporter ATP-binding protein [Rosenbergiella collisarenosi]|uniref:ABC transporter ATP-binding protein n=1 Tax=Rosenbergiella collisarenosi TaxID=1544695 RepID=UPI001BD9B900|nr:ABC transporter ATP-binding protein [Rosenbergiella collisarenosi]
MSECIVKAGNVRKSFKDVLALDDFSLTACKGEIVGLVGPNGAGKTTSLECIQGLIPFDAGSVALFGEDVYRGLTFQSRQRIGIAPQFFSLPPLLTVSEIATLYQSLYLRAMAVDEVIARVGLEKQAGVRFGRLSGGQQRRLALAVALVGRPELLFLDEPTGDLDPQSRRYIWSLLLNETEKAQRAVIISTHQMDEVEALCSRVVIMDEGRILDSDTPQALIQRHCPEHLIRFNINEKYLDVMKSSFPALHFRSIQKGNQEANISLVVNTLSTTIQQLQMLEKDHQFEMKNLQVSQSSLEDVFIKLTGKVLRE